MEWLYLHWTKLVCHEKEIEILDEKGEKRVLQGRKNPSSLRLISIMQAKCTNKNLCTLFVVQFYKDEKMPEKYNVMKLNCYKSTMFYSGMKMSSQCRFLDLLLTER